MEHLRISKINENIHGGSHNNIEAPHDFSLNFWKVNLGSKIEFDFNQFWKCNFISSLVKNLAFGNYLNNISLSFLDKLETQEQLVLPIWVMYLVWNFWEGFCFLCFKFPCVALFNLSNLNKYAMMQCCKAKSEKLAHILGYQTGAITD